MTRLFFDTEFTGLHQKTTLISIGIVSECGKKFYAEFTDYDKTQLNDWLNENVIANLYLTDEFFGNPKSIGDRKPIDKTKPIAFWDDEDLYVRGDKEFLKKELSNWFKWVAEHQENFEKFEIWSDCLSYDWVLFNDIFGTAFDIPSCIYYIPFDICTVMKDCLVDPDINREEFAFKGEIPKEAKKHNALWDAEVIKACFDRLNWEFDNPI